MKRRATSIRASSAAALAVSKSAKVLSGSEPFPAHVVMCPALLRGGGAGAGGQAGKVELD